MEASKQVEAGLQRIITNFAEVDREAAQARRAQRHKNASFRAGPEEAGSSVLPGGAPNGNSIDESQRASSSEQPASGLTASIDAAEGNVRSEREDDATSATSQSPGVKKDLFPVTNHKVKQALTLQSQCTCMQDQALEL